MKHLLLQNRFIMNAIQIDIKKRYIQLKNSYLNNNSEIAKQNMLYYQKLFPNACK